LTNDVSLISQNTGIPEFQIQTIKEHLFFKEHVLDRGVDRFDSDPAISEAWYRLKNDKFNPDDLKKTFKT